MGEINIGRLSDSAADTDNVLYGVMSRDRRRGLLWYDSKMTLPNEVVTPMPDDYRSPSSDGTPGDDGFTYTLEGSDEALALLDSSKAASGITVTSDDDAGQLLTHRRNPGLRGPERGTRLTITATDPSGDSDTANVIVNVTDVNDQPEWVE